jgi:hypothetical protein
MKLSERIHPIGSGAAGFLLTGRLDCHVQAIAPAIRDGTDVAISLDVARVAGVYPPRCTPRPWAVDVELRDRDVIEIGELPLQATIPPARRQGAGVALLGRRPLRGWQDPPAGRTTAASMHTWLRCARWGSRADFPGTSPSA